jgi:hypothetical protein
MDTYTFHVLRWPDKNLSPMEMIEQGFAVLEPHYILRPSISEDGSEILVAPLYSAGFNLPYMQNHSVVVVDPPVSPKSLAWTTVDAFRGIRDGIAASMILHHLKETTGKEIDKKSLYRLKDIDMEPFYAAFGLHMAPSLTDDFSGPLDNSSYAAIEFSPVKSLFYGLVKLQGHVLRELMSKINPNHSIWLSRFRMLIPGVALLAQMKREASIVFDTRMERAVPHIPFLQQDIFLASKVQNLTILPPLTLYKGLLKNECLSGTTEVLLNFLPLVSSNPHKISGTSGWSKTELVLSGARSEDCVVFFCRLPCLSDGILRAIGLYPESYVIVFLRDFPVSSEVVIDDKTTSVIIRPPLNGVKIDTSNPIPPQPK